MGSNFNFNINHPHNIKVCGNCDFCHNLIPSGVFDSSVTGRSYNVLNKDFPQVINCRTPNIIYLITCATCTLQYVGQTVCQLNVRFATHRRCMSGAANASSCKHLSEHFSSGRCKDSDYSVRIIEKWSGDGRTCTGSVDWDLARERRKREDFWMLELRTLYPYGLNDSLNSTSNNNVETKDGLDKIVGKLFPALPRARARSVRQFHNRNRQRPVNYGIFLQQLGLWCRNDLKNAAFLIRTSLVSMNKRHLKQIADYISDNLANHTNEFLYTQWYLMALDIIETKLYKPPIPAVKKSVPKYKLTIPFVNKALDFINVPSILRSETVKQNTPPRLTDLDIPMVVFSLSKPIRSSLLNYKQFVSQLNLDSFSRNSNYIRCCCSEYSNQFMDINHRHIITGNLKIIGNNKLRKLFSRGPKFREPKKINWDEARSVIVNSLEIYLDAISNTKGVDIVYFLNWKNTVLEQVDQKILRYSPTIEVKDVRPVLENQGALVELKKLQNDFIIVPIDKAANNLAFICKQHYAAVILKELDYSSRPVTRSQIHNNVGTYKCINDLGANNIVDKHARDMQNNYGINLMEEMKCLPSMYWIPKMHKDPIGARFIIASPVYSLKSLAKDITKMFKMF